MSVNKVMLLGNLTRDPELRQTPKGMAICKLSVAMNRQYKTQDGERREEVTFVDVDAFGQQAEVLAKYLSKGRQVFIEGRLKLDKWDDKNTGEKRSRLGVILESFSFVSDRGGSGGDSSGGNNEDSGRSGYESGPPQRQNSLSDGPSDDTNSGGGDGIDDDDVPF